MKLFTKAVAVLSGTVLLVPVAFAEASAAATAAVTEIKTAGEDVVLVGGAIIAVGVILYGIGKIRQLVKG